MGRIIAVDRDGERSIPRLREAADAAGLGNVEARVADLEHFDLPSVSVDGAGLDVELGVATKAIRPATPEWRWPDTLFRQLLPMLVDKGHLAGEILDDFAAEWEERSRDPSTVFFSSPVLEVIGRRAPATSERSRART